MGELASKIRAKYPGAYDSLPDGELESKIIAKYPGVYDHLAGGRVEGNPNASAAETERMRREFIRNEGTTKTRIKQGAKDVGRAAMPYVRPVMEGAGATIGGIVGAGAGSLAGLSGGPAAPATVPYGAIAGGIAGGTVGYGIGAKGADILESLSDANSRPQPTTVMGQMGQSLSDLGEGFKYELMGGIGGNLASRSAVAATKYATRTPLQDIANRRAADVFKANNTLTPAESANVVKGAKLTKKLGVKLTPAQMTGKPSLASLEQNLTTTDPAFASVLNSQDSVAKQAALANIKKSVGPGKQMPVTQDLQTTGASVAESVKTAQKAAKPIHEALYDEIPNTPQPTDRIKSVIKMLKKDFRPGDEDVFPSRAISRIEEAIEGPKPSMGGHGKPADPVILDAQGIPIRKNMDTTKAEVGFQDLHSLRKDIGRQIQDASTGMKPNRELAAKLTTIKNAIDETIEESMGADNQYKAAKNAFIDYADKFRTGAVNKVLAKGNESTGLRIAEENIPRQFFTPSGTEGLIKAVGKQAATAQMKPFVISDLVKAASPDGVNFNPQAGINYIQKNRVMLERLGLTKDVQQVIKDQFPNELEKMLSKRAPDANGGQFFTAQDMRGILQKYGNTIKQLYGPQALNSFREYNQLMGMIDRKNLVPRSGGSNTAEKALNVANSMIKDSVGPAKKLTEGLLGALAQGAGYGSAGSFAMGNISAKVAVTGAAVMAGKQMLKNANSQVSKAFVSILQEATLNPAIAADLMKLQKTGRVPVALQTVIDKHVLSGTAAYLDK